VGVVSLLLVAILGVGVGVGISVGVGGVFSLYVSYLFFPSHLLSSHYFRPPSQ